MGSCGKCCPLCGGELEFSGEQTLEMNGATFSSSNLWTDHRPVELWICTLCGHLLFFEPLRQRQQRFRDRCCQLTDDELSALPDSLPQELQDVRQELLAQRAARQRRAEEEQRRQEAARARRQSLWGKLSGRGGEPRGPEL